MYLELRVYDIPDKIRLYLQINFSHQYAVIEEILVLNFFQEIQQTSGLSILSKQRAKNTEALKDYTRTYGCPNLIKTDNAQSELGTGWTQHCQNFCIEQQTTDPHHP